jgi:hypothetical protein
MALEGISENPFIFARVGDDAYNPSHEQAGYVCGVLEFLRFGASAVGHPDFSHDWDTGRMESIGRGNYFAPALADPCGNCGSVCVRLVLAFFRRAQSPGDLWTSAVVVAGRSKNGGDGAGGKNGPGSETMRAESK